MITIISSALGYFMKIIPAPDWRSLIMQSPALANIPATLRDAANHIAAESGETLFRIGSKPRAMLYVLSGEVRLVRRSSDGAEIVLQRAGSGFIAEASLDSAAYHCDIVCAAASHLLAFPLREFRQLLDTQPAFSNAWSLLLAKEVRKLRAQCERLGLKTARERILHYLAAEGSDGIVTLAASRKAWAAELGLTHEALYRALARLQQEQLIALDGNAIRLLSH